MAEVFEPITTFIKEHGGFRVYREEDENGAWSFYAEQGPNMMGYCETVSEICEEITNTTPVLMTPARDKRLGGEVAVDYIKAAVRKERPDAALKVKGVWFWVESLGLHISEHKTTADRAWRSAHQFLKDAK